MVGGAELILAMAPVEAEGVVRLRSRLGLVRLLDDGETLGEMQLRVPLTFIVSRSLGRSFLFRFPASRSSSSSPSLAAAIPFPPL